MFRFIRSFYFIAFFLSISAITFILFSIFNQQISLLTSIQSKGEITFSTINSADTYYLDKNKPAGFEYALASAYAKHLNVKIKILPVNSVDQLRTNLVDRNSDISIPGRNFPLDNSPLYQKSNSYIQNQSVVVYRVTQGNKAPKKTSDLVAKTILLNAGSLQEEQMLQQKKLHPQLNWTLTNHLTPQDILQKVTDNKDSVTIMSQSTFLAIGDYFPNLKIAFNLGPPRQITWLLPNIEDHSLTNSLNSFFKLEQTQALIKELNDKYYHTVNPLNLFDTVTFKKDFKKRLPGLKPFFKKAGAEYKTNWLLLAAIAYQESHWNPKAVSPTGVKGIMMLTKAAAKETGVTDRTDPEQSIMGGAKYLTLVKDKIPQRITEPDRTFFALAGYNVGFGHLEDARILTERANLNPDSWEDVSKQLPLLTKPKYYKTLKHGYARGYEPVNYVKNIKKYLTVLMWEIKQQRLKEAQPTAADEKQIPEGDKEEAPTPPSTL